MMLMPGHLGMQDKRPCRPRKLSSETPQMGEDDHEMQSCTEEKQHVDAPPHSVDVFRFAAQHRRRSSQQLPETQPREAARLQRRADGGQLLSRHLRRSQPPGKAQTH